MKGGLLFVVERVLCGGVVDSMIRKDSSSIMWLNVVWITKLLRSKLLGSRSCYLATYYFPAKYRKVAGKVGILYNNSSVRQPDAQ